MLYSAAQSNDHDSSEWAQRSEFWRQTGSSTVVTRKRREREIRPLILCGHGVSMRIESGTLVVKDGFTHYPQEQAIYRFFRGALDLPERIVILDGSGTLSLDVLSWLAEQGVALARIKWTGEVAAVANGNGYAADREKVRWQEATRSDESARLAFALDLIRRKLEASAETLEKSIDPSPIRDRAIKTSIDAVASLRNRPPRDLEVLRAIEAVNASAYFGAWRGLPMEWSANKRHPIPDDWRVFTSRTSLANGTKPKNVNASHPVNAMLNYAYAVKTAQLQIEAIADGYDPTIGIMHHGRRGAPAYVFDLIEPERPKVDALILAFIQGNWFSGADFVIRPDGVCRLSPQLARVIVSTCN